jgi:hypothetical protein
MSWGQTYSFTVAIALDLLAAAVFFNTTDICVSSLCRLVQLRDAGQLTTPQESVLAKLAPWQIRSLRVIAAGLEKIQPGHCRLSLASDVARALRVIPLKE